MDMTEKTLKQDYKFRGRIVNMRVDEALMPDGTTAVYYTHLAVYKRQVLKGVLVVAGDYRKNRVAGAARQRSL